jgi:hypothetical protein
MHDSPRRSGEIAAREVLKEMSPTGGGRAVDTRAMSENKGGPQTPPTGGGTRSTPSGMDGPLGRLRRSHPDPDRRRRRLVARPASASASAPALGRLARLPRRVARVHACSGRRHGLVSVSLRRRRQAGLRRGRVALRPPARRPCGGRLRLPCCRQRTCSGRAPGDVDLMFCPRVVSQLPLPPAAPDARRGADRDRPGRSSSAALPRLAACLSS